MATALYSLLSGRKIRYKLAMTGELSLIGKVLPVGGIKEKLLAAKRAGIKTIILPKLNEKDMIDIPTYAYDGLQLHFVSHVEEVFQLALEQDPRGTKLKSPAEPKHVLKSSSRASKRVSQSKRYLGD